VLRRGIPGSPYIPLLHHPPLLWQQLLVLLLQEVLRQLVLL
jgi:hypothetical protein